MDDDDLPDFYRLFDDGEAVQVFLSPHGIESGYIVVGMQAEGGRGFHGGETGTIVFKSEVESSLYAVCMDDDGDYYFFDESCLVSLRKSVA